MKSKEYHRVKYLLLAVDLALSIAFLVTLQASGLSLTLQTAAVSRAPSAWLAVLIYMTCFFNLYTLVSLPTHFISSFVVEKKFNLSNQKLGAWLKDEIKKYALSFAFFIITVEFFYGMVQALPHGWWIAASIGWLFLTLFLSRILPTVLIPIFYPVKALPAGELKEKLFGLCRRCGIKVLDIYEIALSKKTKRANAALVGIGRTRRVILGDTLLGSYDPPEIEMVVAHEIGHHAKKHIAKSLTLNFVITFAGFYLLYLLSETLVRFLGGEGLTDLFLFPSLALLSLLGGLLILPLQNGFSRYHENEADCFALEVIPREDVFISLMNKLGSQNLADLSPHPWVEFFLYDHPSISNRLRNASRFLKKDLQRPHP